jgi:hypothetical protein
MCGGSRRSLYSLSCPGFWNLSPVRCARCDPALVPLVDGGSVWRHEVRRRSLPGPHRAPRLRRGGPVVRQSGGLNRDDRRGAASGRNR